jgi:hypothetical protein
LAREIKVFIEAQMTACHGQEESRLSFAKEISKLKKLLDEGVLSPDEFVRAKAKLLG